MWQIIYDKLKSWDLNPYAPGQHEGLCENNYCVIREEEQSGMIGTNKVGYRLVDFILFVPIASYIQVEPYINSIKAAMKELPQLKKTGNETPVIVDDEIQAYTTSIEYQILKKL
ncbi:MAG: hypothetical protein QME45_04355 [Clostridiales bacterium]|nr:hypothetical protein [Clostridiales bacterium]